MSSSCALDGESNAPALGAGKYVDLKDTISGFKGILEGKFDDLPEQAFYMVGDVKEAEEKADKLAREMANQ